MDQYFSIIREEVKSVLRPFTINRHRRLKSDPDQLEVESGSRSS